MYYDYLSQKKPKKIWSKPSSESSASPGQHGRAQQDFFNKNHKPKVNTPPLPEKPNNKGRPSLPVQDPPWLKKKTPDQVDEDRLNHPCPLPPSHDLPSHDAPWVKNRTPSDKTHDRLDKPCPLPVQDPPWLKNKTLPDKNVSDNRLSKRFPSPSRDPPRAKNTPSDQMDDRLNKPCPVPPPKKAGKGRDKRFSSFDYDEPPPPPPPERGSSQRDLFEQMPPKVPNKTKQPPVSRKPFPPPVKSKSVPVPQDDDFDFPTAAEYKKSQAVASPSSVSTQPPSLPPRVSSSQYRDPIDDRPPIPPPKSAGRYYH